LLSPCRDWPAARSSAVTSNSVRPTGRRSRMVRASFTSEAGLTASFPSRCAQRQSRRSAFEFAVDAGRLQTAAAQVPAVVHNVHRRQLLERRRCVPTQKQAEVALIAPYRHRRQIFPAELLQESGEPGVVRRVAGSWVYCTQGHPPRYDPVLLRTIRGRTGQHSIQLDLCAGIVRKINAKRTADARILTPRGSKLGALE